MARQRKEKRSKGFGAGEHTVLHLNFSTGSAEDISPHAKKVCDSKDVYPLAKTYQVFLSGEAAGDYFYIAEPNRGLEGSKRLPNITLYDGLTYEFDFSHQSMTNHVFRLSTTFDGAHEGGSQYTVGWSENGTPGTSGSNAIFSVGADAEATTSSLYYYDDNFAGGGGETSSLTNGLIKFSKPGQVSSSTGFYKSKSYSAHFTGDAGIFISGDGYPHSDKLRLNDDFTISFWAKSAATGYSGSQCLFDFGLLTGFVESGTKSYISMPTGWSGENVDTKARYDINFTGWNHFCLARTNGYLRYYINGTGQGKQMPFSGHLEPQSNSSSGTYYSIGCTRDYENFYSGYMDDFFVHNVSVYGRHGFEPITEDVSGKFYSIARDGLSAKHNAYKIYLMSDGGYRQFEMYDSDEEYSKLPPTGNIIPKDSKDYRKQYIYPFSGQNCIISFYKDPNIIDAKNSSIDFYLDSGDGRKLMVTDSGLGFVYTNPIDPHFENVKLLVESSTRGGNMDVYDYSNFNRIIKLPNIYDAQTHGTGLIFNTTKEYKFGKSSISFPGLKDYVLNVRGSADDSDFDWGSGEWTIDSWINISRSNNADIMSKWSAEDRTSWRMYTNSGNGGGQHIYFDIGTGNNCTAMLPSESTNAFSSVSTTKLLIHSDTTGGQTFTDSSSNNVTITTGGLPLGEAAAGSVSHSTDEKKFGSSSILFSGRTDLRIPNDSSFGSENAHTWECWFNTKSVNSQTLVSRYGAGATSSNCYYGICFGGLSIEPVSGRITWEGHILKPDDTIEGLTVATRNALIASGLTINTGEWYHVAAAVDGSGGNSIFFDGARAATGSFTGWAYLSGRDPNITIGAEHYGSATYGFRNHFSGYMDEIRFSSSTVYSTISHGCSTEVPLVSVNTDPFYDSEMAPPEPMYSLSTGWNLVSAQRNNTRNQIEIFINGGLSGSGSIASEIGLSPAKNQDLTFGDFYAGAGYIDSVRITKDVARYSGNFVPTGVRFPNKENNRLGMANYSPLGSAYRNSPLNMLGITTNLKPQDRRVAGWFSTGDINVNASHLIINNIQPGFTGTWSAELREDNKIYSTPREIIIKDVIGGTGCVRPEITGMDQRGQIMSLADPFRKKDETGQPCSGCVEREKPTWTGNCLEVTRPNAGTNLPTALFPYNNDTGICGPYGWTHYRIFSGWLEGDSLPGFDAVSGERYDGSTDNSHLSFIISEEPLGGDPPWQFANNCGPIANRTGNTLYKEFTFNEVSGLPVETFSYLNQLDGNLYETSGRLLVTGNGNMHGDNAVHGATCVYMTVIDKIAKDNCYISKGQEKITCLQECPNHTPCGDYAACAADPDCTPCFDTTVHGPLLPGPVSQECEARCGAHQVTYPNVDPSTQFESTYPENHTTVGWYEMGYSSEIECQNSCISGGAFAPIVGAQFPTGPTDVWGGETVKFSLEPPMDGESTATWVEVKFNPTEAEAFMPHDGFGNSGNFKYPFTNNFPSGLTIPEIFRRGTVMGSNFEKTFLSDEEEDSYNVYYPIYMPVGEGLHVNPWVAGVGFVPNRGFNLRHWQIGGQPATIYNKQGGGGRRGCPPISVNYQNTTTKVQVGTANKNQMVTLTIDAPGADMYEWSGPNPTMTNAIQKAYGTITAKNSIQVGPIGTNVRIGGQMISTCGTYKVQAMGCRTNFQRNDKFAFQKTIGPVSMNVICNQRKSPPPPGVGVGGRCCIGRGERVFTINGAAATDKITKISAYDIWEDEMKLDVNGNVSAVPGAFVDYSQNYKNGRNADVYLNNGQFAWNTHKWRVTVNGYWATQVGRIAPEGYQRCYQNHQGINGEVNVNTKWNRYIDASQQTICGGTIQKGANVSFKGEGCPDKIYYEVELEDAAGAKYTKTVVELPADYNLAYKEHIITIGGASAGFRKRSINWFYPPYTFVGSPDHWAKVKAQDEACGIVYGLPTHAPAGASSEGHPPAAMINSQNMCCEMTGGRKGQANCGNTAQDVANFWQFGAHSEPKNANGQPWAMERGPCDMQAEVYKMHNDAAGTDKWLSFLGKNAFTPAVGSTFHELELTDESSSVNLINDANFRELDPATATQAGNQLRVSGRVNFIWSGYRDPAVNPIVIPGQGPVFVEYSRTPCGNYDKVDCHDAARVGSYDRGNYGLNFWGDFNHWNVNIKHNTVFGESFTEDISLYAGWAMTSHPGWGYTEDNLFNKGEVDHDYHIRAWGPDDVNWRKGGNSKQWQRHIGGGGGNGCLDATAAGTPDSATDAQFNNASLYSPGATYIPGSAVTNQGTSQDPGSEGNPPWQLTAAAGGCPEAGPGQTCDEEGQGPCFNWDSYLTPFSAKKKVAAGSTFGVDAGQLYIDSHEWNIGYITNAAAIQRNLSWTVTNVRTWARTKDFGVKSWFGNDDQPYFRGKWGEPEIIRLHHIVDEWPPPKKYGKGRDDERKRNPQTLSWSMKSYTEREIREAWASTMATPTHNNVEIAGRPDAYGIHDRRRKIVFYRGKPIQEIAPECGGMQNDGRSKKSVIGGKAGVQGYPCHDLGHNVPHTIWLLGNTYRDTKDGVNKDIIYDERSCVTNPRDVHGVEDASQAKIYKESYNNGNGTIQNTSLWCHGLESDDNPNHVFPFKISHGCRWSLESAPVWAAQGNPDMSADVSWGSAGQGLGQHTIGGSLGGMPGVVAGSWITGSQYPIYHQGDTEIYINVPDGQGGTVQTGPFPGPALPAVKRSYLASNNYDPTVSTETYNYYDPLSCAEMQQLIFGLFGRAVWTQVLDCDGFQRGDITNGQTPGWSETGPMPTRAMDVEDGAGTVHSLNPNSITDNVYEEGTVNLYDFTNADLFAYGGHKDTTDKGDNEYWYNSWHDNSPVAMAGGSAGGWGQVKVVEVTADRKADAQNLVRWGDPSKLKVSSQVSDVNNEGMDLLWVIHPGDELYYEHTREKGWNSWCVGAFYVNKEPVFTSCDWESERPEHYNHMNVSVQSFDTVRSDGTCLFGESESSPYWKNHDGTIENPPMITSIDGVTNVGKIYKMYEPGEDGQNRL